MRFWGVSLKPNEPYTLQYDNDDENVVSRRLRITQATLGDSIRVSPARSVVRCSVGDKPAIAICSLTVKELSCCQLELEFDESHDVVFSVMGPRGVHLAGYFIPSAPTVNQHSIDNKEQETAPMEIPGFGDNKVLPENELDLNKTGPVKEPTNAQNTNIEDSDKNIEEKRDAIENKQQKKKKSKKSRKRKPTTLEANDLLEQKFTSDSGITEENKSSHDACEIGHKKVKKRKRKHKKSKNLGNAKCLLSYPNHGLHDMIDGSVVIQSLG